MIATVSAIAIGACLVTKDTAPAQKRINVGALLSSGFIKIRRRALQQADLQHAEGAMRGAAGRHPACQACQSTVAGDGLLQNGCHLGVRRVS